MGEVGEEHGRLAVTSRQFAHDLDVGLGHHGGELLRVGPGVDAVPTRGHAVVRNRDEFRIEAGAARTELRQDSTPVGIFAVEGTLHELGPGNAPSGTTRLILRPSATHL